MHTLNYIILLLFLICLISYVYTSYQQISCNRDIIKQQEISKTQDELFFSQNRQFNDSFNITGSPGMDMGTFPPVPPLPSSCMNSYGPSPVDMASGFLVIIAVILIIYRVLEYMDKPKP